MYGYIVGGIAALLGVTLAWWRMSGDDGARDGARAPRLPPPAKASSVTDATHREGVKAIGEAWGKVFPNEPPTRGAIQVLAGIAALEGSYGKGTYRNKRTGESAVIWNAGAIQGDAVDPAQGKVGGFLATDYNPTSGEEYEAKYQRYATQADGLAALVRLVERYSPEALRQGHILRVSKQMYTGEALHPERTVASPMGYYQGRVRPQGTSEAAREAAGWENIRAHAEKLHTEAAAAARASGEELVAFREDLDWYVPPREGTA